MNFTEEVKDYLDKQNTTKKQLYYTTRRIMVIKIRNTNVFYHFPIEACFYNSTDKDESIE